MGKLNLILVIFFLVAVFDSPRRVNGVVFSFLAEVLKSFGRYMLSFVQSRVNVNAGTRLEKLVFGDSNREHIEKLHREILRRMDEFSNELSASTLKIIKELTLVVGVNSKVTTLLQSLMKEVYLIEAEEQQFRRIWDAKNDLNNKTVRDFVQDMIRPGMNSMPGTLEKINALIREKHLGGFDESLILVFVNYLNSLPKSNHCGMITAPRQVLYHLFSVLVETEMKGYFLMNTGYTILQMMTTECYNGEKRMLNATFEAHMENILENFGKHFFLVSKFTYNCAPEQYVENGNYARLAGVQPIYIYNERDIFPPHDCVTRCIPSRTHTLRRTISDVAKNLKSKCKGKLKGCQPLPSGMNSMCLQQNPNEKFVKYSMPNDKCQQIALTNWLYDLRSCEYCSCICDEDDEKYYVYLGATEVLNPDRVVTGVRLVLENNVLYWQLQTGKPRAFGFIDTDTMEWQPLPTVTKRNDAKLFHRINAKQSFIMRNLEVPAPYVLAGIQFFVRSLNNITGYDMNLFGHKIDLMEGKLYNGSRKFTPYKEQFDRFQTNNLQALVNVNREEQITIPAKDNYTVYVTLGYSSIKHDFGQHLVPFFDIRNVTSSIPMPLKGVGLYHRTNENHAGFIAPRLIAINPVKYIDNFFNQTDVQSEED